MAEWGARIQARVERSRPRVRAQGAVTVQGQVSRDGQVLAMGITRPSGNPAVDQAALQAVRQAGRFPAAPEGLPGAAHRFNLPMRFQ